MVGQRQGWWRVLSSQGPVLVVLVLSLVVLALSIGRGVSVQVEQARGAAKRDLATLLEFARAQTAAFAGTSFIGYGVGRYYGFAPAFAQISPDPERAAALLRGAYLPGQDRPADLAPALLAYDAVHERFHPSFVGMIAASVFDDMYLVDRFGRVVYSLRKDAAFAADLRDQKHRNTPLAGLVRAVNARLQQAEQPDQVLVVTEPERLDDGFGILLGRPIVRHGTVEGVVAFRLPLPAVERRLAGIAVPGIRFLLLDGQGKPLGGQAPGAGETAHGPFTVPDAGWPFLVVADDAVLAGPYTYYMAGLMLLALAALAFPLLRRRREAAVPLPVPIAAAAPAPLPPPAAAPEPELPPPAPEEADPHPAALADESHAPPPDPEQAALDADEGYRRALVDVMTLTLDYWQKARRKGKVELAEESGIWRVYMDRSSLQTRTLDKYLLVETLPRNPRWRDVVRTAEYVLRHCNEATPERDALAASLNRLKLQLRQAERI